MACLWDVRDLILSESFLGSGGGAGVGVDVDDVGAGVGVDVDDVGVGRDAGRRRIGSI